MNLPEEKDKIEDKIAELYDIQNLHDVTIVVFKGIRYGSFRANSFALSFLSPYFAAVISSRNRIENDHAIVIEDINPTTFHKLLKFIHYKPIDISSVSEAWDLFKVANLFLVPRLQKYILSKLEYVVKPAEVGVFYSFIRFYKLANLFRICLDIIKFRTDEILQSYKTLSLNDFILILRTKYLNVQEIDLFLTIQKWIAYRKEIGREISPKDQNMLKRLICFLAMSEEEIAIVAKTKFMSPEENQWFENYDVSKIEQYPSHLSKNKRVIPYMYSLRENFPKVKEKLTRSAIVLRTDTNIYLNRINMFTQEGDPTKTYMEDLTFILHPLDVLFSPHHVIIRNLKYKMQQSSIFPIAFDNTCMMRKNVNYWMAFIKEEKSFEEPELYYQTKLNGNVFVNRVSFYLNRHILVNYSPKLPVAGFEYSLALDDN